ncbi:acetoin utilization deacetylase AcuC-like enzyme [Sagittula marina]|uniref:Acetoin utilization deacetylase AcuC-like enzyme n=1 Tax=Sagittula marina TaxID=943940 RepID=A0A7W6GS14_9RHOB|nr:histone deacetylase family protein [Sagittula marina]MBB3985951.1 acetoin utilization deacetylase AcuC-like enzyme [Sagittula marina]
MATALITHADGLDHVTPSGHPERVARLEHVLHALQPLELQRVTAREASEEELLRCHPQTYIDRVRNAVPERGQHQLDSDTWLSPGSFRAASRAAGGACQAVDMVLGGEVANVFCATRPPGHHAERETPMGFCLFGTAAIAAKHALEHHGLSRVAVVDFDVHHGNGTQDLLWDEARALFITSQQMPLWPGSGAPEQRGAHDNVMNLPLPPETGGAEMKARYEAEAFPRLRAFDPELLIISAGFDAHQDDPLANLNWTVEDFRWITEQLCQIAQASAAGGRVVSTLEGGYDLAGLSASAKAHVEVLMEAGA